LRPGTQVFAIDKTRTSKWDPQFEGPFTVVQQNHGGAYTLKDVTGQIIPQHFTIDMLKPVAGEKSQMAMPSEGEDARMGRQTKKEGIQEKEKAKITSSDRLKSKEKSKIGMNKKQEMHLEVERILDHRMKDGVIEYLVKWKDYGDEENQWRTVKDFDSLRIIKEYWKGKEELKKLNRKKK
jgi:hypothetical protein